MPNSKGFKNLSMALALTVFAFPAIVYANDAPGGWSMPDNLSSKEVEEGKALLKQTEGFGSNAATFALCLLMVGFVGPNKVLKDDACRDSVKSSCRIDSTGRPKPWKCAVFPMWAM